MNTSNVFWRESCTLLFAPAPAPLPVPEFELGLVPELSNNPVTIPQADVRPIPLPGASRTGALASRRTRARLRSIKSAYLRESVGGGWRVGG